MGKMYRVTVKGTGQLNGPYKINDVMELEEKLAQKFNGANRYEVIEAHIKSHHPGVKIDSIRSFAANVVLIPDKKGKSTSENNSENSTSKRKIKNNEDDNEIDDDSNKNASIFGAIVGGIAESLLNNKTEEFDSKAEKEKIDLEYYRKQKEFEFENQKRLFKQEKIDALKAEVKNGGNKFIYVVKRLWLYLDKTWKKVTFIIFMFYATFFAFAIAHDYISLPKDRETLMNANEKFATTLISTENELKNLNFDNVESQIIELEKINSSLQISNEFLFEEKHAITKQWTESIAKIKNDLNEIKTAKKSKKKTKSKK